MGLSKAEKEHAARCALEDRKTYTELGAVEFREPRATEYMDIVRKKLLATGMGVTINGPYVTVRFSSPRNPRELASVTMQVTDIHDTAVFELEDDK